jgi:hypothetical protein
MRADELQDSPVLTPEQVLRLRGVNPDDFHFDVAIFCFRGQTASRKALDAFPVTRIEPNILYGSEAYAGRVGDKRVVILPQVVWGGPVTAILLEELACFGVQTAIGFGAAGSLVSPQHVGKMLVADRAVCSDGTSQQYTDEPYVGPASELLRLTMAFASQEGVRAVYLGLVTDYVGGSKGWQHGLWSRPNTTDPLIVRLIQQLVQAVDLH